MKITLLNFFAVLIAAAINSATAQGLSTIAPQWNASIRVVDDEERPMANAAVKIWYHVPAPPGQTIAMTNEAGFTGSNGIFVASAHSRSFELACEAQKAGYYSAGKSYELGASYQYDPEKWSPTITLVLKKIRNPIPMYAKKARVEVPDTDKPIGFDLAESDWVSPYGKGKKSDFVFEIHRRFVDWQDFDASFTLTFSNGGDGLLSVPSSSNESSALRLPAIAPEVGYQSEITERIGHTPAGGWQKDESTEQNYYFRVRTIRDENGNIRDALFGKIYGDFRIDAINSKTLLIFFTYYLNPERDSRNVEFDPNRNLFGGLPANERVDAP